MRTGVSRKGLAHGFNVMVNVIKALILRELKTRFGSYRFGYAWILAEPLAHVIILSLVFGVRGRVGPLGIDFPAFVATGIIPWTLFYSMVTRGMSSIEANRPLFTYRQVRPLDALIARSILEICIYSVVFVVFMFGLWAVGFDARVKDPLGVMFATFSLAGFGFGIGLIAAVLTVPLPDVAKIIPIVIRPIYLISGIFFSVDQLPTELRDVVLWNPVLHALEIIRANYFVNMSASHGDVEYFAWFVVVPLVVGLTLLTLFHQKLIST